MLLMNLLKQIEFTNLIMGEEEEQFQWSNTCSICEKLIDDDDDEKVSDHCDVTGKFRGAAR